MHIHSGCCTVPTTAFLSGRSGMPVWMDGGKGGNGGEGNEEVANSHGGEKRT